MNYGYAVFKLLGNTPFRWLSCAVPPVPIPNTEVKRTYTDNTWLETAREDRQLPGSKETQKCVSFLLRALRAARCIPDGMHEIPDRRDMSATRYVLRDTGNADHIAGSAAIPYRVRAREDIVRRKPHIVSLHCALCAQREGSLRLGDSSASPQNDTHSFCARMQGTSTPTSRKRSEIRYAGEIAMR